MLTFGALCSDAAGTFCGALRSRSAWQSVGRVRLLLGFVLLVFLAVAPWTGESAAQETGMRFDPISLAPEDWRFRPGDDMRWAAHDYDHGDWPTIEVPGAWGRQDFAKVEIGWYRVVVDPIPEEMARVDGNLGLFLGPVASSYTVYAGGRKLGGNGAFPPLVEIEHDRHRLFAVPADAVIDGRLTLAVRVYRHPALGEDHGGLYRLSPELGRLDDLATDSTKRSMPRVFVGLLSILLGLYVAAVSDRRRRRRVCLSLASVLVTVGLLGLAGSQFRFALSDDFVLLKKLELTLWALLPALWLQWLLVWTAWRFWTRSVVRAVRVYQALFVLWILALWATPGLVVALSYGRWVQWLGLPAVALGMYWSLRPPRSDTLSLWSRIGLGVAGLGLVVDMLPGGAGVSPPLGVLIGFPVLALAWIYDRELRARSWLDDLEEVRSTLDEKVETRTQELVLALDEAESLSRSRIEFLANVSHEIRTPMMGILGVGDLLLKCDLEQRERRYAETIRSSAVALLGVLNDILDYSKIEAGYLTLEPEAFEVREAVRGIVELLRPKAQEKGIDLHSQVWSEAPEWVWGDPWRLRQVLINLVGNAIKFTHQGKVILEVLPARQASGSKELTLRFAVRDTGVGVAPQEIPGLFDPFTQTGDGEQKLTGTGLGLAISRRIVESMNGRIGADSQIGHGSNFWFEIPLRAVEEPSNAPVLSGALQSFRTGKVLLAEDNEVNRMVVLGQLESLGVQAEAVHDGQEALEAVAQGEYDLVLMDCQMPRLDGYEATRRIRALKGDENLPVVAVTAHAFDGERERCLAAGMDDYLVKPFEEEQLAAVLDRWMSHSEVESASAS